MVDAISTYDFSYSAYPLRRFQNFFSRIFSARAPLPFSQHTLFLRPSDVASAHHRLFLLLLLHPRASNWLWRLPPNQHGTQRRRRRRKRRRRASACKTTEKSLPHTAPHHSTPPRILPFKPRNIIVTQKRGREGGREQNCAVLFFGRGEAHSSLLLLWARPEGKKRSHYIVWVPIPGPTARGRGISPSDAFYPSFGPTQFRP